MYCEKCGTQNELNSKFCSVCGNDLNQKSVIAKDKIKNIKVMSIIALICAFILPPVGIILSSIALSKSNKYKKEMGIKSGYTPMSIVGLVLSIFITIMILCIILILIGVFSIYIGVKDRDDILKSTWECKMSTYSTTKVVTATFNDDNFIWAKYGDERNNYLKGTYNISNRQYKNGKNKYSISFYPNYYVLSGKKNDNYIKSTTVNIEYNESNATINFSNSTTYYCERVSNY